MRRALVQAIAIGWLVSGCAFSPQAIVLTPQLEVAGTNIGAGRQVLVTVDDERPSEALGVRGAQKVGAELTIQGKLADTVALSLANGLQRQGFVNTATRTPDVRELHVEIRSLSYDVLMGFWEGTVKVECGLKAICSQGPTRGYEHFYRGTVEQGVQAVQTDSENTRYVNRAVSSAINQILQDTQLSQCLAQ